MIKTIFATAASLLFAAAPMASATTINLNFDLFAYGTDIHDYYNGGRDSLNRAGSPDYGISFSQDRVRYTSLGGYLSGPVIMTLDPNKIRAALGSDNYYITFSAARDDIDGGSAFISYESGFTDSIWIAGNGNPYCSTYPGAPAWYGPSSGACDREYFGFMSGYYTYTGEGGVTRISFGTNRLDNIQIRSIASGETPVRPPSYYSGANIPEPGSMALIAVGAAALVARRRRSEKRVVKQGEQA